jgi:superfamily II DNA or RNA helicase
MLRDSQDKTGHGRSLVALAGPCETHAASAKKGGRARAVLDRPQTLGWSTSDAHEIALRQWRGRTEITQLEALEPEYPVFGCFRVAAGGTASYEVEIRNLEEHGNSCGCIDHRVNRLGTCKHIEGVLAALNRQASKAVGAAPGAASTRVEIFLDRREQPRSRISWPKAAARLKGVRNWLSPFLNSAGELHGDPRRIASMLTAWSAAPAAIRRNVRISRHFAPWLEREQRLRSRARTRRQFLAEVARGSASFDLLQHPLLPYQREGMMHLAFNERALLADEMGLGKTVQAIAACELLARRHGIERVLIVCPASLKAEWEEQIARFSGRAAKPVFGPRAQRLAAYGKPAFFNIVNYEQVLSDADDINAILQADIVVLDEAQRIKNWHTKTARRVKQLRSLYAFVLTGTPLENRIDELYSIVQYLDPELLGPLFRFNRDFYELDERGRPVDYKNLVELRQRVAPIMLRRRKADVEAELPGRTISNFFVPMADEQRARYEDYELRVARLLAQAKKRPLTPDEFKLLQQWLACMRMICDTPAILDPKCRISPKLEELERVLGELLEEPDRKVIVFSEWERMLEMVRELAREMAIETAWHTGSVPQQRRRAEIMRFKQDPSCRLFLSTDSGSLGLNLQVASAVVNVDLPWNPARLEQRIARAWRKGQLRGVTVVNMVCEDSIEHGMLQLLDAKQALADGVLDGRGDISALKMPSGRGAMVERIRTMLQLGSKSSILPPTGPDQRIADDLLRRHGERALLIEARKGSDGRVQMLVVLDVDRRVLAAEIARNSADASKASVEVIDQQTWHLLQRLEASGHLQRAGASSCVLHQSPKLIETADTRALVRAKELRTEAERALRKAQVLAAGGFAEDAPMLLLRAIGHAAAARLALEGEPQDDGAIAGPAQIRELVDRKALPQQAWATLEALSAPARRVSDVEVAHLLNATADVLSSCAVGETEAVPAG